MPLAEEKENDCNRLSDSSCKRNLGSLQPASVCSGNPGRNLGPGKISITFAIGVAKAKSAEVARLFARYVQVMNGEMNIHSGYMGKLQVTQEELEATPRALDNLSYTSYMLRVAYEEGEAEILAAILSCAYSYEVIAKNIVKECPASTEHPFYGEWIKGYASDKYAGENAVLLDTLNRLTAQYTEQQIEHLVDIFIACSRYELAFWEMSWNQSK